LEAVFRQLPQDRPWRFIGFSLGANLLLKWLGESQAIPGAAALAVSCPFDLAECAHNLEQSAMARLYRFVMIRRLKALVGPFSARFPEALASDTLKACRTFFDFDETITARLHGFEGAKHYWEVCSSVRFMPKIATPTTLLHSTDDPFQRRPPVHIQNPLLRWEIYPYGGHLGFQETWSKDWFLERLVAHALS
jgi:predicted alpha/beta-fold hydrolase